MSDRSTTLNIDDVIDTLSIPRPESVCSRNGTAIEFMSNNMKSIFGPDYLKNVHSQVIDSTHANVQQAQHALGVNLEVERIREEKERVEARASAAEAQVLALQSQLAEMQVTSVESSGL